MSEWTSLRSFDAVKRAQVYKRRVLHKDRPRPRSPSLPIQAAVVAARLCFRRPDKVRVILP